MYDMLNLIDTDVFGFLLEAYHHLPHFHAHFRQLKLVEKVTEWINRPTTGQLVQEEL